MNLFVNPLHSLRYSGFTLSKVYPLGMYDQSIEENVGGQEKSCFRRLFGSHHSDYDVKLKSEHCMYICVYPVI